MHARHAIGLLIVVVAGALAGRALAPDPQPQRTVRAGPATLAVPAGWAPERLAVTFGQPADRTLVPRALRARVSGPPRPIRLGGQRAWAYRAHGTQVVVLPTTRGVLGLACAADCAGDVAAVQVARASTLTPTPDLALALALRPTLAELDAARVRLRAALAGATAPSARSSTATALAREHAMAAERLRPFAGATGRALIDRLDGSGRAYDRLATATPARFNALRDDVAKADAQLAAAVARLRIDTAVQPAGRPSAPTARQLPAAVLLLAIALAGALLAARPGRRRPAPAPEPIEETPPRVAPSTAGRWDAAPRPGGAGPLSALGTPPPPR